MPPQRTKHFASDGRCWMAVKRASAWYITADAQMTMQSTGSADERSCSSASLRKEAKTLMSAAVESSPTVIDVSRGTSGRKCSLLTCFLSNMYFAEGEGQRCSGSRFF